VKFINTDGMAFIGPGSEWLWTMISALVRAVTFIAIYRQLAIQRGASAAEQLNQTEREYASERLNRNQLALCLAGRAVIPASSSCTTCATTDRLGTLPAGGSAVGYAGRKGRAASVRVLLPSCCRNRRLTTRSGAPEGPVRARKVEATIGFEPMNKGFADPRVRPLRHVARVRRRPPVMVSGWLPLEDSNLG
jgi:hypothetical protein